MVAVGLRVAILIVLQLGVAKLLRGEENPAAEMLAQAAKLGDLQEAEALLATGLDPDFANQGWRTPLCYAALYKRNDFVSFLLAHHADPNKAPSDERPNSDYPQTALQIAASKGNLPMVLMLAAAGAQLNIGTHTGRTALHFAAVGGYADVIRLLVERGADVNVRDVNGVSPLDDAVWRGYLEGAAFLLSKGAGLNDTVYKTGATPINEAAFCGRTNLVRYLLELHANLLIPDRRGYLPLENSIRMGHEETATYLLEATSQEQKRQPFLSRLMDAAIKKDEALVVERLLRDGVNVHGALPNGDMPLNSAARENAGKVVRSLLNAGADANKSDANGITPLEDACLKGSYVAAEVLLENGAAINMKNSVSGETALYAAASFGRNDMVQLLLQRGADPNICNQGHKTAYSAAVVSGYSDIAGQIKQRGGSAICREQRNGRAQ